MTGARARRSIFVLLVYCALAAALGWEDAAEACTCVPPPTLEEACRAAHTAFRGKVLAAEWPPPRHVNRSAADSVRDFSPANLVRYVVLADIIWKGVVAETLIVYSDGSSASCGFPMRVGAEYILFASRMIQNPADYDSWGFLRGSPQASYLNIGLCGGSRSFPDAATDLASLGAPIWTRRPTKGSR